MAPEDETKPVEELAAQPAAPEAATAQASEPVAATETAIEAPAVETTPAEPIAATPVAEAAVVEPVAPPSPPAAEPVPVVDEETQRAQREAVEREAADSRAELERLRALLAERDAELEAEREKDRKAEAAAAEREATARAAAEQAERDAEAKRQADAESEAAQAAAQRLAEAAAQAQRDAEREDLERQLAEANAEKDRLAKVATDAAAALEASEASRALEESEHAKEIENVRAEAEKTAAAQGVRDEAAREVEQAVLTDADKQRLALEVSPIAELVAPSVVTEALIGANFVQVRVVLAGVTDENNTMRAVGSTPFLDPKEAEQLVAMGFVELIGQSAPAAE